MGAVLLLAVIVGWLVFERAIRLERVLHWDEGSHSLWGLVIADDLVQGRWVSLAFDTYRQVLWPPLHSWYLGMLFALFGPSTALARSSSLLAFMGSAVIIYFAARLFAGLHLPNPVAGSGRGQREDERWERCMEATVVGGVAASASLLSAEGVQILASVTMVEVPGLFALAVCFWLYGRCWLADAPLRAYVLLGLMVFATYLMRTTYGVLMALSLAATVLIDGEWLRRSQTYGAQQKASAPVLAHRRRGQILTALSIGLPLIIWLAHPSKLPLTLRSLINVPEGPDRFSLEGLLFFPSALGWLAGSWQLLLAWLLCFGLTLRAGLLRSNGPVRLVVIFLAIQMLLAELHSNKQQRYILPLALGFSLLTGVWASRLFVRFDELNWPIPRPRGSLAMLSVAAIAALTLGQVRDLGRSWALPTISPVPPLLTYLADDIRQQGPCLLVASIGDSPSEIDWHLAVQGLLDADGLGSLASERDMLFVLFPNFSRLPLFLPSSVREQVDRWPGTSGTFTAYVGLPSGAPAELTFTASNYSQRVAALIARRPIARILAVSSAGSELNQQFVSSRLGELGFAPTAAAHQIQATGTSVIELRRR